MSFSEKMDFIFPGEEIKRVHITAASSDSISISLDVHGMQCWQAERSIHNLINISTCPLTLTVIHGYNRGTVIMDMVRNRLKNNHIKARYADKYNQGITYLVIA